MSAVAAVKPGKPKKRTGTTVALATAAILLQPSAIAAPQLRECGCPQGQRCECAPRLRIFDPMGRVLLSPVYY